MKTPSPTPAADNSGRESGPGPALDGIPDTSTGLLRDLEKGPGATRWPDFERRYDPVLRRFLAILARTHPLLNPDDCDDVVQETLLQLWKLFPKRAYDRSRGRFRDFLFGVTRLVATRRTSEEKERLLRETEAASMRSNTLANAAADAALRAEATELWRLVVDKVFVESRWSDKAKAVYIRTERGEDMGEVAAEYGMTANSVYQLRHRASLRVEAALRALARETRELCQRGSLASQKPKSLSKI